MHGCSAHVILAAAVALAACARPPVSRPAPSADEAAVRAARAEQNAAIAERDIERVAQFWTEDVTIVAGLGFSMRGRESYRQAFALTSTRSVSRR